ncbi:RDD family protein [Desulfonema magnum]|uniref:RDD domain-containing protein n=1 Tax=Desulfonema magnum TaxID=45655 RepID=A0A975GTT6_9BACT|nr:RDD family protein [Desulfonema magnum]QTA92473.1 RDD domain-containing protein [Desulfonema magnum]
MNKERKRTLTIKTPEGIAFSLHLAGPVTRFLAWLIDLASIFVISLTARIAAGFLGVISPDIASAAVILAYFIISIGYGIAMEWYWRGQTIGKRLLRLRVMDEQGLRLQFNQVVIRNLLRFVDSLPAFYMVGGLACLVSPRVQRLGDLAANTIVVWNGAVSEPDLDQLLTGKYNSFRNYPHLEARLRHHISVREAGIVLQALLRRDELDPSARLELFKEIAMHFKRAVKFPQEATDGISDEQYVRNVADVLFRSEFPGR